MSAITIGGELIHYEVLGRGRPIILLHGWVGSWRYWVPTMQNLQLKYRVYALDLHGFGDTSKNEQKYSISSQVQLLRDFMEMMAIPKAAVVGHGLGAWVAVEFARQTANSDRVARMMLVSPPMFQTPGLENRHRPGRLVPLTSNAPEMFDDRTIANSNSMRAQAMLERELARGGRADSTPIPAPKLATQEERQPAHNPLLEIFNSNTSEMLLQKCFRRSDPTYTKLEPDLSKTADRALKESAKEFDSGRMLDSIWLLNMPTVILHGKEDVFIKPPSDMVLDYITADKDESTMVQLLDGVRHFPMLEYERFLRLLNDFLEVPDISKLEIKERWKRRSR